MKILRFDSWQSARHARAVVGVGFHWQAAGL